MKISYLSASRAKTYIQCPFKYHLSYEKGVKGNQEHLMFGVIIHEALEKWYLNDKQDDLIELYNEAWKANKLTNEQYYKEGIEMLNNYMLNPNNFRYEVLRDEDGKPVVEREFKLEIGPGVSVVGVIDRVDYVDENTIEIVDYKTSRFPLTQEEMDTDLQLSIYDIAAREMFPQFENVRLSLNFLREHQIYTTRTDRDRQETKQFLINLYHQIVNDTEPQPVINQYCSTCDGRHLCPAYKDIVLNSDVNSILDLDDEESKLDMWEQLELVKQKMKILKRRQEEIEESFKNVLKKTDTPIEIDGREVYLSANSRVQYDYNRVVEVIGLERLPEVVSITKSKVDRLVTPEDREFLTQTGNKVFFQPTLRSRKIK